MATHSYEKEIREKSLIRTPVSSNFKVSQKLDKYMQEGKKSKTLSVRKTLKGIQGKVVLTLAPLTKLMGIMEEERELIPAEQVKGSGMIMISRIFDQAVLLVGQVYNLVVYQRRLNILSALIDNKTKVKEILKEDSLKLDNVDNSYLFRDHLQEKFVKITSALQKSKSLFTGLQKKLTFAYSSTSSANNYLQLPF